MSRPRNKGHTSYGFACTCPNILVWEVNVVSLIMNTLSIDKALQSIPVKTFSSLGVNESQLETDLVDNTTNFNGSNQTPEAP